MSTLFDGNGNRIEVSGGGVSTALKGLNYYAWGDSITDYQSTKNRPQYLDGTDLQGVVHTNEYMYGNLEEVEDRYGCICTNYGRGGHAAVGDYPNLVAHDFSKAALVTLAYGTNDARQDRVIGTADSADFDTFAGALNGMLRKIYMDNPDCKVLVLTCPQRLTVHDVGSFTPNGVGKTLEDYANMAKLVAGRRSTVCVDLFHDSGLNQVTLYRDSLEGVHPLASGYKRMSQIIIPAIDAILSVDSDPFNTMIVPSVPPSADSPIVNVPLTEDMFTIDGYRWNGTDGINGVGSTKQVGKGIRLEPGKTYLYDFYNTWAPLPERYFCVNNNETEILGSKTWGKGDPAWGFSDGKEEKIGGETYYRFTVCIAVPKEGGPYYLWPMRYNALGVESLSLRYF